MPKNPDNSMSSYIASERFKTNANLLLNITLTALGLEHYKILISDDIVDALDVAYNENYMHVLENAFKAYPEVTQALVDSVKTSGEVTEVGQLATLIISELVTNLTVCQVIVKMMMAVNNEDN